ncbi:M15 family metallopeptidase [Legionella sp. D16C41]|uniref:M15 family metallopeptidase n=1 Tax=Legionella sp. D16C41 TaxID=3402688 RepID=UPI003AF5DCB7
MNAELTDLARLKKAYPDQIHAVSENYIVWTDGTRMAHQEKKFNKTEQEKLDHPSLSNQIVNICYKPGIPANPKNYRPKDDPGRIRYEPFFRKMYGNTEDEVKKHLITIYWMPKVFGHSYPLRVTTVNQVDQKLKNISKELEVLVQKHPNYIPFLDNPSGTFTWRLIANTHRLSNHSFGMTIDINADKSDYWQWDLKKANKPIIEAAPLPYYNSVPWEIVPIFEKYGFIWGGKWYHYDSMHFEYRPELLLSC